MVDAAELMSTWATNGAGLARGLPATAYTDEHFWKVECDRVLAGHWVFAGFAHELARPGDAVPVTVAGKPVLLLKNREGTIGAFHNVCRHRCLQLVEAPRNVGKRISCPYHAWAYELDGTLFSTPHFGGMKNHRPDGFDPADHALLPVRLSVWHDWIFVNLDGKAPSFEDYAAPMIRRLDGIDFDRVQPIATLDFGEIAANWKLIMENFIEPYHVPIVHSKTTDQPLRDHYTFVDGPCLGSIAELDEEKTEVADSLAVSSRYLTLFPNFIIGRYYPDQLGVYLNVPLGPGRTAQKRVIYTTDTQVLTEPQIEALKNLWWGVHKEDHTMCERMQIGRTSPVAASGGVLSPYWEDSVHAFQKMVSQALASY